jgi:hypothetical protein
LKTDTRLANFANPRVTHRAKLHEMRSAQCDVIVFGAMSNEHPTRAADLAEAQDIIGRYGQFIAPKEKVGDIIAQAIADGIAFGRRDGIAIAAKDMFRSENERWLALETAATLRRSSQVSGGTT